MKLILLTIALTASTQLMAETVNHNTTKAPSNYSKTTEKVINNQNADSVQDSTIKMNTQRNCCQKNYEGDRLFTIGSKYDHTSTVSRIEKELESLGLSVFAKIDHGENAKNSGLEMPASVVLLFGSPVVGTNLMVKEPSIAIELPLRIAIYEDSEARVWITCLEMKKLAKDYGLDQDPIIGKMEQLLKRLSKSVEL